MKSLMRAAFAIVGLSISAAGSAETVTIRADDWAPINSNPRAANRGVMIELAEQILAKAGHTVDYRILGWEESKKAVAAGEIDCIVGSLKDEAAEAGAMVPTKPWVVSQQTVYGRADRNLSVTKMADLQALKLGAVANYSYGTEIDQYIEKVADSRKLYLARGARALRELLLRVNTGLIDVAVETNVVMDYNIALAGLTGRIKAVGTLTKERDELFIACSAKKATSKAYIALFDAGYTAMRKSGEFQAILKKYSVKDWE